MEIAQINQRRGRERVGTVLFYAAVVLLAYAVYRIFEPFLVPLGWAAVIAVVSYPKHERLARRFGDSRAAAISTLAIALLLVLPALFLVSSFIHEGVDAARELRENIRAGNVTWFQSARDWLTEKFPALAQYDLAQLAREGAERAATFFAARAGGFLRDVVLFFFDLFVMLFALFFFFRDYKSILDTLRRLLPFTDDEVHQLTAQAQELIQTSVTSSFIIAGVQGLLGGIAFAAFGITGAIFWGVTMAFLALIPLLGTGLVIGPAAVWLLLTGQVVKGLLLAAIGFGVIGTVDNILRPFLVRGRTQMSALVLFISVMGGISVFGMLGLVLGPIVVATAESLLAVYGRTPMEPAAPQTL